ncbi:MAG: hypothetical protein ACJA1A_002219 [Saprospiraceae bacterium]|jgi:hypothetical protein
MPKVQLLDHKGYRNLIFLYINETNISLKRYRYCLDK